MRAEPREASFPPPTGRAGIGAPRPGRRVPGRPPSRRWGGAFLLLLLGVCFTTGCGGEAECRGAADEAACNAERNRNSNPGDFATDFLREDPYASLLVEVDFVSGYPPNSAALAHLQSTIEQVARKPGGVTIEIDTEIPPQGNPLYSTEAIESLEDTYRDRFTSGGRAVLYLLYLDGGSERDEGNAKILGLAHRGASIAMFKRTIQEVASLLAPPRLIEQTTLDHEFGHLIGLVNSGIGMVTPHEDPDHPAHDVNPHCIMYFANNGSNVISILETGEIPFFDDNCLRDIAAAGGRDLLAAGSGGERRSP